jgi:hypothetical protein
VDATYRHGHEIHKFMPVTASFLKSNGLTDILISFSLYSRQQYVTLEVFYYESDCRDTMPGSTKTPRTLSRLKF